MDNALARLLGQEPLESLDGPGKGNFHVVLFSNQLSSVNLQISTSLNRVPTRTGKPGKMGRHFPVREKSGNFEQTGKVREKSGKITQNTGKLR